MNILERIIADKREELKLKKELISATALELLPGYNRNCISLRDALSRIGETGIIAEFKRKSPSRGVLNESATITEVVQDYAKNGATGISILTDEKYFDGLNDDIEVARALVNCPILRKDFIIEEYQLIEAKAIGADVILLIAACLTKEEVKRLAMKANSIGLESLLEIHEESELGHICEEVDMIGINNRNLKTLEVDINTSLSLINKLPSTKPAIAESGISKVETIKALKDAGFKGFLIGENFMKEKDPGKAFKLFVEELIAS